jgi:hypothetical protein
MRIDASRRAQEYVRWRGSDLYVWFTPAPASSPYVEQRVSTSRPEAVKFRRFEADGFAVQLDVDFEPPEVLTVRLGWPIRRLRVTGTGVATVGSAQGGG